MSGMSMFMILESFWELQSQGNFITKYVVFKVLYTLAVIIGVPTLAFFAKLYWVRSRTFKLKREGFAMPPVHPLYGHIPFVKELMSKIPNDAHQHYLPDQIRQALPELGPIYYIDAWPFMTPTLFVASPDTLQQITEDHMLPKFPAIRELLKPLTKGVDLMSMDGQQWKGWRSIFNPGFSANSLMNRVPGIVEETMVFCEVLAKRMTRKYPWEMKILTDSLAVDIVGRVVLGKELNSQVEENRMVTALRRQMEWLTFGSEGFPILRYVPIRPFVLWFNGREMNEYLSPVVDDLFSAHHDTSSNASRSKPIIDLAISAHLNGKTIAGTTTKPTSPTPQHIDSKFKKFTVDQVKLFLYSGHDTTSSALCYIFYLLSKHPAALTKLRNEHTTVFSSPQSNTRNPISTNSTPSNVDTSGLEHVPATSIVTATMISQNPYLLNRLPYTTAVIKEALRLFPPASTTRAGEPGFHIKDPRTGLKYPTNGFLIQLIPHAVHRDPAFWPRVDEFLPERWLAAAGDPLAPTKGSWRPFEHGPRACIGQELSMVTMKVVLCLVARGYEIKPSYEEIDERRAKEGIRADKEDVNGERAYQLSAGQPWGDLPVRVRVVEDEFRGRGR